MEAQATAPPPPPPQPYSALLERNTGLTKQVSILQKEVERLKEELSLLQSVNEHVTIDAGTGNAHSSLFDLPLTAQKRVIRIAPGVQYNHYFPLELTDRDYLRRILEIVANGIRDRVAQIWFGQIQFLGPEVASVFTGVASASRTRPASTTNKPRSASSSSSAGYDPAESSRAIHAAVQDPVRLLEMVAGVGLHDAHREMVQATIAKSLNAAPETLAAAAKGLLRWRALLQSRGVDSSRLLLTTDGAMGSNKEVGLAAGNTAFDAALSLLECFTHTSSLAAVQGASLQASRGDASGITDTRLSGSSAVHNILAGFSSGGVSIAIHEIKQLRQQCSLHAAYKEARLAAVGWAWDRLDRDRGLEHNGERDPLGSASFLEVHREDLVRRHVGPRMHDSSASASFLSASAGTGAGAGAGTGSEAGRGKVAGLGSVASKRDTAGAVMRRVSVSRQRRTSLGGGATGSESSFSYSSSSPTASSSSAAAVFTTESNGASDAPSSSSSTATDADALLPALSRMLRSVTVRNVDAEITQALSTLDGVRAKLDFNVSSEAANISLLYSRLASWVELLEEQADEALEGGNGGEGKRLQDLSSAVGSLLEAPLPASKLHMGAGLRSDGRHRKSMFSLSGAGDGSLFGDVEHKEGGEGDDDDELAAALGLGTQAAAFGSHPMETESGWARIERLQALLEAAVAASNTARTLAEQAAQQHHFDVEDSLLAAVARLAPTHKQLTKLLLTSSPLPPALLLELSQPLHGGTALLTADLVFSVPCPLDGTCIASLAVKVGYLPLVRHIYRTWPGLTLALQRSEAEEAQVAVLMGRAHAFGNSMSSLQQHALHASLHTIDLIHHHVGSTSSGPVGGGGSALLRPTDYLASTFHLNEADGARIPAAEVDAQLDYLTGIASSSGAAAAGAAGARGGVGTDDVDFGSPLSLRIKLMLPLAALRRTGSFSDDALLSAGFRPLELRGQGFSGEALRKGGYTAGHCHALGMSVHALLTQGFPPAAIVQTGGYSFSELRAGNIDIQRHVLMGLFDALDGKRWKKKTNWGTPRPLNEWFGVVLNSFGDVVKIDLRGNNLCGQLPTCLALLPQLEYLDLFNNGISGRLEPWIVGLANLRDLWLTGNPIEVGALVKQEMRKHLPRLKFRV